jgi:hypothetical protein
VAGLRDCLVNISHVFCFVLFLSMVLGFELRTLWLHEEMDGGDD